MPRPLLQKWQHPRLGPPKTLWDSRFLVCLRPVWSLLHYHKSSFTSHSLTLTFFVFLVCQDATCQGEVGDSWSGSHRPPTMLLADSRKEYSRGELFCRLFSAQALVPWSEAAVVAPVARAGVAAAPEAKAQPKKRRWLPTERQLMAPGEFQHFPLSVKLKQMPSELCRCLLDAE